MIFWRSARRCYARLRVRREGLLRRRDGFVDVRPAAERDRRDALLGGGVHDREVLRLGRLHPLPVDVELAAVLHDRLLWLRSSAPRASLSPALTARRVPGQLPAHA